MPGKRAAGTRLHSVSVPDDLWKAATAKAADRGESVSEVIRQALREYLTSASPRRRTM